MGLSKISQSIGNYFMEDGRDDEYVILHPKTEHKFSLIFLHGMGDTASGFKDVFAHDSLVKLPEGCKVILPTASKKPVTVNGGTPMNSWFDIKSNGSLFNQNMVKVDDYYFDEHFSQDEITQSTDILLTLLKQEIKTLGSAKNVFIGGFS